MAKIKRRQKPGLERNTTQLIWKDKRTEVDRVPLPFQTAEIVNEPREKGLYTGREFEDGWRNKLIWGDNKYIMASLLPEFAGKINLIYIDPPFATGADFSINIKVGDLEWTKEASVIEELAYRDTWGKGLDSYLQMMYHRLVLMRELLAESGSIYVHLDWHVGHYVKAIMDEIFGKDNFRNMIIWHYRRFSRRSSKSFPAMYDSILFYGKSIDNVYKPIVDAVRSRDRHERGYHTVVDAGVKKLLVYDEKKARATGIDFSKYEKVVYTNVTDTVISDVWQIPIINPQAKERVGFPTQKPEALAERIIKASSNDGDLIADFFCGSGTTGAVAEKLNRRWIMSDLSKFAIHTTRKRLLDNPECRPFEILNLGNYQKQKFIENQHPPVEKYIKFVLELYRAERLDGYYFIHGKKAGRLVHIASVDSMVTQRELRDVLEEVAASGSKALDVLGWDFEMGLHGIVQQIADEYGVNVRLVQIPKEALEVKSPAKEEIKFFDLNFVEVDYEVKRKKLVIELKDFVIANQEYIPDEVRAKIKKFTDYIDYWAVDFDYKEDTFHNAWQSFRTRKHRSLDTKCPYVYKEPGEHLVLVKVVDIFGNDTNKVLRVMVG